MTPKVSKGVLVNHENMGIDCLPVHIMASLMGGFVMVPRGLFLWPPLGK
jgi:hypothetical protein